jgi:anti-sigma-K factor RskA
MNERNEHTSGWDDDLAAYALGALEADEARAVEAHLEGCASCRERVRWLTPAVDILPATVPQQDPPAELRERLMAVVEAEAGSSRATAPARAATPDRPRRSWLDGLRGLTARPALVGLGVGLLLVAGVVGYSLRDGGGAETHTYAAVPVSGKSPAEGTLTVNGDSGSMVVRNLPAVGEHEVYQAWIRTTGDEGDIAPSSVFVLAKDGTGHVSIPSGLDGAAEVMVTREPVGGSAQPHENPLVTASMD